MADTLPYGRQSIDESDIEAVIGVLQSDRLTDGPTVGAFEDAFAQATACQYAAACGSGTAALHLAAMALNLKAGDHVVVPAITFLATANVVRFVGAEVIFADVNPDTGLMMPENLEVALESAKGKPVKAVITVHLNGQCGDPAGLETVARRHGLNIIEDACHALGAIYHADGGSYRVGSCAHSDLTAFSFHPVKTITCGEGGMVTGKDASLIARIKLLRNHGMVRAPHLFVNAEQAFEGVEQNPWYYEMPEIGLNYRLSDIHCALGLSQLKRLDWFVDRRAALVARYRNVLAPLAPSIRPLVFLPDCRPAWHLFVVLIEFGQIGQSRNKLMRALRSRGIGSQVHYIPLYLQPYYRRRYGVSSLPGAETYYTRCLSLPLYTEMDESDVERVVEVLSHEGSLANGRASELQLPAD